MSAVVLDSLVRDIEAMEPEVVWGVKTVGNSPGFLFPLWVAVKEPRFITAYVLVHPSEQSAREFHEKFEGDPIEFVRELTVDDAVARAHRCGMPLFLVDCTPAILKEWPV